jgi:hypothetical protein
MDQRQRSLRERAEALLNQSDQANLDLTPVEVRRLVHDLSVYQIELELQNEDLRVIRKISLNAPGIVMLNFIIMRRSAICPWTSTPWCRRALACLPLPLEEGQKVALTVSIGVTIFFSSDSKDNVILVRVDQALYRAKQTGRKRVEVEIPD